jgi:hypothetical protein
MLTRCTSTLEAPPAEVDAEAVGPGIVLGPVPRVVVDSGLVEQAPSGPRTAMARVAVPSSLINSLREGL